MHLVDEYPLGTANGTCYFCGASKRPGERLIDTERSIDFEGFLVVCETCVATMANLLGFVDPVTAARNADDHDAIKKSNTELKKQVTRMKEIKALAEALTSDV